MSTVTIQTQMTVDDLLNIIRQLRPIEKQKLLERIKTELGVDEPTLPESVKNETWAQRADASTRRFLALCGSWEDSRSVDEIVDDIYQLRASSRTEIKL
jgi:hypothetical protein